MVVVVEILISVLGSCYTVYVDKLTVGSLYYTVAYPDFCSIKNLSTLHKGSFVSFS